MCVCVCGVPTVFVEIEFQILFSIFGANRRISTSTSTNSIIVGFVISQSFYDVHIFPSFFPSASLLSLFFHFICKKSHLEFGARMYFQRKFEMSVFRHSLVKNSSKHIQNVIHYTMNCYLEFNLFSI